MKKQHYRPTKKTKREIRQEDHLTVPPRLKSEVKNVSMNPVRKTKRKKNTR